MPLGVKKKFYWHFPSCFWSLQKPVISANALLLEINNFWEEINWSTSLSGFLKCPRRVTPWYSAGDPTTWFLWHKFPASGICVLVALSHSLKRLFSSPGRTHKHILLSPVGGGGSDFTVGTWIGHSRHVPFCCPGACWLLEGGLISIKGEREDEDRPTFFTSLFGEEGKTNVSNYFRQFFWINDKAFWYAGNNCFPSRVFGDLKGNKATPNLWRVKQLQRLIILPVKLFKSFSGIRWNDDSSTSQWYHCIWFARVYLPVAVDCTGVL